MLYREFIPRELAPGWLQTSKNAAWLRASGDLKDSLAERCKDAVKVRFARLAPRDGLDQLGGERQIERGPSETNAAYAERVVDAWGLWRWAGTAQGVLLALRDVGYATALVEILIGIAAGWVATRVAGPEALGSKLPWLTFLSSTGSVALTFLAGAELDPATLRKKWQEVTVVGLVSFAAPFIGCALITRHLLGWTWPESWLAGVALSTTSMAVVYAVMLESGFNETEYGKGILCACFITDLGTVIALGLIFAPFTLRTLIFVGGGGAALVLLPLVTPRLVRAFADRPGELPTKWILLALFGLGALAIWAGSEAVLPATDGVIA